MQRCGHAIYCQLYKRLHPHQLLRSLSTVVVQIIMAFDRLSGGWLPAFELVEVGVLGRAREAGW